MASAGWRGRATGLPGVPVLHCVRVPASEHSPPSHPGTVEGPQALGDTQPSRIWPSCASPAQPRLLCSLPQGCGITGSIFASGWALPCLPSPAGTFLLSLCPKHVCPGEPGSSAQAGGGCGGGHGHMPSAETQECNGPGRSPSRLPQVGAGLAQGCCQLPATSGMQDPSGSGAGMGRDGDGSL